MKSGKELSPAVLKFPPQNLAPSVLFRLNLHPHFHIVVTDGVFETENGSFKFHEAFLTPDDSADTQDNIRKRVLRLFAQRGWIEKDEIEKMLTYENSRTLISHNGKMT